MTNTSVDLAPKVGIEDGLHSLTDTPVRYVLLPLILILFIIGAFILRDAIGWPRQEFLFEIGKDRSEQEQDNGPGTPEKPEIKFHLRIRIPPRKRNQP